MKRLGLAVVVALSVSSCGSVFQNHYAEYEPTETKVLTRAWFERDNPAQLEPVYCYKTLVEMECFDQAMVGSERPAVWTYRAVKP